MSFEFKTKAQQKLEYLESLKRPLSDEESADLLRSMHAVYVRERRLCNTLRAHRTEELELIRRLQREALQGSALA